MSKRFLIAGNWKMNKNAQETRAFFNQLKNLLTPTIQSELLICPPFTSLETAAHYNQTTQIALGAQNVHPELKGAFTGEISPAFLKGLVSYVIIGHSERRTLFGETSAFINQKLHALLSAELKPILCVGESLQERKQNKAFSVIETELEEGLKGISADQASSLTIAYEPIWAIGTGETATPEIAEAIHAFIRKWLTNRFPQQANSIRLLYGGSLKSSNAQHLLSQPNIDGGLIGGASLEPNSFIEIARIADQIRK